MSETINTKKVSNRRKLKFATLEDALAEARRCADADNAGALQKLGNWSLGKTLGHMAAWVDYAFDGYPAPTPLSMRIFGRLVRPFVLRGSMPAGIRMPGSAEGTFGTEEYPAAIGLERLTRAYIRLQSQCPEQPSPGFGKLSHAQWMQLHCRHAELHLGFFVPSPSGRA